MSPSLTRRLTAEALGTAFLLAIVVGSGIMAERLSGGNIAIALLANTIATGTGLVALILTFGAISSEFNPVVSLMSAANGAMPWRLVPAYVAAQLTGAFIGVWSAHVMFAVEIFQASTKIRTGGAQWFSEFVATFGLLVVIAGVARHRKEAVPYAVGAYITAAYWFTASTSFANPVVTLARSGTDTFAGIKPTDTPMFIAAQLAALLAALMVTRLVFGRDGKV